MKMERRLAARETNESSLPTSGSCANPDFHPDSSTSGVVIKRWMETMTFGRKRDNDFEEACFWVTAAGNEKLIERDEEGLSEKGWNTCTRRIYQPREFRGSISALLQNSQSFPFTFSFLSPLFLNANRIEIDCGHTHVSPNLLFLQTLPLSNERQIRGSKTISTGGKKKKKICTKTIIFISMKIFNVP